MQVIWTLAPSSRGHTNISSQRPAQIPQWIFAVDSLKDADLRKDVPFGGSL